MSIIKKAAQIWKYRKRNREKKKPQLPIQVPTIEERILATDLKYYDPVVSYLYSGQEFFKLS